MRRLFFIAIFILLLIIVFSVSLTPLRSTNDAWWHLKTGKILLERNLSLPRNDIFAYTSADVPWHNHEWLAQVIFYLVFQLGDGADQEGIRMVILLKALILLGTYLLVFGLCLRETKSIPIAILVAMWALLLSRRTIYPRPPVFSYFFFAGYVFLLRECFSGRIKKRWLWILPPVMILWVNIHGGFLLGIIAVGAYVLADIVKNLLGRKSLLEKKLLKDAGLLVSCIVASLVNPYTYHLYFLSARVMSDTVLVRIIPELHSPDFFFTISFEVLILFLIVAFAVTRRKSVSLAEGLLLVFFMHQALQHVRHLPLIGIVAAPVCARLLVSLKEELLPEKIKSKAPYLVGVLALLLAIYTVFNHREGESFLERNRNFFKGIGFYEQNYPVPETRYILSNDFTGRMYNQINDAGYLIWKLSPERHKVFTDSRYDIFGGKFMRHEQIIQSGYDRKVYPGDRTWDELLDYWDVNFILITADAPVNPLLEKSGRWKPVYHRLPPSAPSFRRGYKIYIRDIPENRDLIARCLRASSLRGSDP